MWKFGIDISLPIILNFPRGQRFNLHFAYFDLTTLYFSYSVYRRGPKALDLRTLFKLIVDC